MTSLAARLVPAVIALRGSKRRYASAERTRARVALLREHPKSFEPDPRIGARRLHGSGWPVFEVGSGERTVVYLHGGANIYEIDPRHWSFVAALARATGHRVVVPIYPLAPIETAGTIIPTIADLVESTGALAIAGDSAGGNMALAAAMLLRDRGAAPVRVSMISPCLDLTFSDPRVVELARTDPWLEIPGAAAAAELYRGDLALTNPLVSSFHGALDGLGPLQLFIGTRDMLLPDSQRLRDRAAAEGHALDYHEVPHMLHVYPILPIPEARVAREQLARFLA